MAEDARLMAYRGELAVLVEIKSRNGAGTGILFRSARGMTAADVIAMAVRGRGICTVTIDEPTAMRLQLHAQAKIPHDRNLPCFVNSVEARA